MRRGKRLLIMLLALALVALAAAGAVYLLPDENLEEYEEITLLSFEQEDALALSYTYEDETVELVNDDGTWEYALDADFPLDSSCVDSMLASLSSLAATQEITAPEDTAQYGLDEPVLTVIKGGTVSVVDPAGERHAFEVSDGFISFDFNKLTVAVERGRDVVRTEGPGIE